MRECADTSSSLSYLIFPDRVKLLLRRLRVGVIARLDIIVLRGEAQSVFRRSGGCSLLIARRDGRLDSVETGLKIHSETARINGPTCLTPRKTTLPKSSQLFSFRIPLSFNITSRQTIGILQSEMLRRTALLHAARGRAKGKRRKQRS